MLHMLDYSYIYSNKISCIHTSVAVEVLYKEHMNMDYENDAKLALCTQYSSH